MGQNGVMGCVLLVLTFIASVQAALYGIVTGATGNETQSITYTVQVDSKTGNFTFLAENFLEIGDSAMYDGISAFDQTRGYLYYASDFESAFVFGVDVAKKQLRPPISISADGILSILYDHTYERLLITGQFGPSNAAIFTLPSNSSIGSELFFNFTSQSIAAADILTQTVSYDTSTYFYVIKNNSDLLLGHLTLDNPTWVKPGAFPCSALYIPFFISYDKNLTKFIGLSTNAKGSDYFYFEISSTGKCGVSDLKLRGGLVTCTTYDPTATTLYFSYVDDDGSYLQVFNTVAHKMTQVNTPDVLSDIEASYQL